MTFKRSVCVLLALIACAVSSPRPSAQAYGECGYIWVGGSQGGDTAYGWAQLGVYGQCGGGEYGFDAAVVVDLYTPWGGHDNDGESTYESWDIDGYVDVEVPLQPGEAGVATTYGSGGIGYYGFGEGYNDQFGFWVERSGGDPPPPPPPPSPTITFSPSASVTRDYDSGDVIITAEVSPAGYGWEQQLYWVGEGHETGNPMERRFSTSNGVGNFSATAVIASQTEATAYVKVVPVLVLWPPELTATQHPTLYLPYSAQVFPEGAATVEWSGAGWTHPETSLIRYINRDVVGTHVAFARAGESQQQQVVASIVPNLVLRLVLDEDGNFNPGAPTDDAPAFIPGTYYGGASRLVSEMSTTGQVVRLIAFYADAATPNQVASAPAGSSATFYLEETSAWNGFATNAGWPDNSQNIAPDFIFPAPPGGQESLTRSADFGDGNIAFVEMRVRDYGGRTRVRADASTGHQAPAFWLPRDNGNNWLPDAGWKAPFTSPTVTVEVSVTDDGGSAWTDSDEGVTPATAPPPNVGLHGDGLTRFEEYRGFVVNGFHTRTSPAHKDLFVSTTVTRSSLTPAEGLRFARGSLFDHGVRLHHIRDQSQSTGPGDAETNGLLLNYSYLYAGGDPQDVVGASYRRFNQLAVRLQAATLMGDFGVTDGGGGCVTSGGYTPNEAPQIRVDIAAHVNRGSSNPTLTTAQIDNEIRRTVGHELGHGVHVMHKGPGPQCSDGASTSGTSMMTSSWFNGADAGNDASKYNDADVVQMRIHQNP